MSNDKYNGWTNYETWVVNLWIDNDEGMQDMVNEWADDALANASPKYSGQSIEKAAAYDLSRLIKDWHGENTPTTEGVFADLLNAAIDSVNWYEIAEHFIGEAKERAAEETEEEGDEG